MPRIRTLKPNVTREEATEQFSPGGLLDSARSFIFGPLRSVADVYIPFRLFQVEIVNGGKREQQFLGLEAIAGILDLYHFEQVPSASDVIVMDSRNCPPARLDHMRASELLIEKFRRVLFSRGFFRLRGLELTAMPLPGEIHIPYWVGFRGHAIRARLDVIDAVRRRFEGAKVRRLLTDWLASVNT